MEVSHTGIDVVDHTQQLGNIIRSNQAIRRHIQVAVNDFLEVRTKLLNDLKKYQLDRIDQLKPFAETINIQTLNKKVTAEKVQLALCGENSSGKTSFLHTLLQIGDILPSGVGPVTARIIKLTYADPKDSCILRFKSLEDSLNSSKSTPIESTNLSQYFKINNEAEPDAQDIVKNANWAGIKDELRTYVERPPNMDSKSNGFDEWAREFIEIRLPSPTLRWNIDVYDTPGFLFDDAPVLKDILSNLANRIHPTLVFLYDNPSTTDDMNNCYLAMKSALKQSDSSSIFYLNTKADIEQMPDVTDNTTLDEFKVILNKERAQRYDLLRKAPCLGKDTLIGLPESVDNCNCFELCSVISHYDELGAYMNNCAIRRLVQFVANSDLVTAKRVTSLVLPAIEAFFDLALVISHRTLEQLQQLQRDALQWHSTFLLEHKKHFSVFLGNVYDLIMKELSIKRDKLIRDASKLKDKRMIEPYIRLAVKHEVVKQVVTEAISAAVSTILKMLLSNRDLMVNASSNELLVAALRTEETEVFAKYANESIVQATFQYYILNNIITPTMMVAQLLFSDDEESDNENILGLLKQLQNARSKTSAKISANSHDLNDPTLEAQECLRNVQSEIISQKSVLEFIIGLWSDQHEEKLREKIKELYKGAEKLLPARNKAHELVQKYASSFARIYCHLHAAQDFAKFDGMEPIIQNDDSQSTVYSIHRATWGRETNLLVKKLSRPVLDKSDIDYFEGQYHLKVRSLNIPYIVHISYLYEKVFSEGKRVLWMFFPLIDRSLKDFIQKSDQQLSLDTALDIMTRVATALACLHQNELVHRNVIPSNIVIDNDDRAYLIDLGDWSNDNEECNISTRHDPLATKDGVYDDIRALGKLGLDLLLSIESSINDTGKQAKWNSFRELMTDCTKAAPEMPMLAQTVKDRLRNI